MSQPKECKIFFPLPRGREVIYLLINVKRAAAGKRFQGQNEKLKYLNVAETQSKRVKSIMYFILPSIFESLF